MSDTMQGTVVLGFGSQELCWISKAQKLVGQRAQIDMNVARMAGADIAVGTPAALEAAAKAAFKQVQGLAKMVDGLQAALGAQVRFGSEGFLAAIEKLPRYTYNYASEDGKFLLRDEVLAAIASQARQATLTADMGNTTSQPPAATEAGNPASGAQDKMPPTQQPEALRLAELIRLSGALPGSVSDDAASELRRLHAENQDLRTRHYCNTAEIESLQARVQELGEMARENRSKRIVELEGRIAEMEFEAEQNAKIIGASAETELALRGWVEELERKLVSIGAGGVEPLRSSKVSVKHSEAIVFANDRPDSGSERLMEWAIDAEDLIRSQHAMIVELNDQLAAIGAGGVEPLRKRSAPAVVVVQEENHGHHLLDAVLNCPHSITHESVTLHFYPRQKEGHNALAQLHHRLAAYDQEARQREMQLLSEIEALERLALVNLKQQGGAA